MLKTKTLICENCGDEYEVSTHINAKKTFCSLKCKIEYNTRKFEEEK